MRRRHLATSDPELSRWIAWQHENGCLWLHNLTDLAYSADRRQYALLRPALLTLSAVYPIPPEEEEVDIFNAILNNEWVVREYPTVQLYKATKRWQIDPQKPSQR